MTSTLARIRDLLMAEGFEIEEASPKVPQGGIVASRGAISILVYMVDGQPLPDAGIRLRVRLTPDDQRPEASDIASAAEVPGLRRFLVVER